MESIAADERAVQDLAIAVAVAAMLLFLISRVCLGFPDTTVVSRRVTFAEADDELGVSAEDPWPMAMHKEPKYGLQVVDASLNKNGQRMCSLMTFCRMATKPPRHCGLNGRRAPPRSSQPLL